MRHPGCTRKWPRSARMLRMRTVFTHQPLGLEREYPDVAHAQCKQYPEVASKCPDVAHAHLFQPPRPLQSPFNPRMSRMRTSSNTRKCLSDARMSRMRNAPNNPLQSSLNTRMLLLDPRMSLMRTANNTRKSTRNPRMSRMRTVPNPPPSSVLF